MTREIMFRAWTPPEKPYRDVESASVGHNGKMIYEGFSVSCKGTPHNSIGYTPLRLMQYTGLKDKNGKEIYESDIVEYTESHILDDGQKFKQRVEMANGMWRPTAIFIVGNEVEIIGNIYENPELLK